MKALIFENKVVDIAEKEFDVHASLTWMDAPIDCEKGWHLEDEVLYPPDPIPAKDYAQNRLDEYPSMADYLDGIVKDDQAQIDKYIEDCKAIKTKYPKG